MRRTKSTLKRSDQEEEILLEDDTVPIGLYLLTQDREAAAKKKKKKILEEPLEEEIAEDSSSGEELEDEDCRRRLKGKSGKSYNSSYNRCFPVKIMKELKRLEDLKLKHIDSLEEVGFIGFKYLQINQMHVGFCDWVISNFNANRLEVRFGSGFVWKIKAEDVHTVYKLPIGDRPIKLKACTDDDMDSLFNELGVIKRYKDNIDVNELYRNLPLYESMMTWRKAMILCIIGYVICPTTNYRVSLRYAQYLKKPSLLSRLNWCEHVLWSIQTGLERSQLYKACDFNFLMINYVNQFAPLTSEEDIPLCKNWTRKAIYGKLDSISNGFGFNHAIADSMVRSSEIVCERIPNVEQGVAIPINPHGCKNLDECEKGIACCKTNIEAWSNCLRSLEIKEKEFMKDKKKTKLKIVAKRTQKPSTSKAEAVTEMKEKNARKVVRKGGEEKEKKKGKVEKEKKGDNSKKKRDRIEDELVGEKQRRKKVKTKVNVDELEKGDKTDKGEEKTEGDRVLEEEEKSDKIQKGSEQNEGEIGNEIQKTEEADTVGKSASIDVAEKQRDVGDFSTPVDMFPIKRALFGSQSDDIDGQKKDMDKNENGSDEGKEGMEEKKDDNVDTDLGEKEEELSTLALVQTEHEGKNEDGPKNEIEFQIKVDVPLCSKTTLTEGSSRDFVDVLNPTPLTMIPTEGRITTKRIIMESKWLRSPYGVDIRRLNKMGDVDNKLVSYAINAKLDQGEAMFQSKNSRRQPHLYREDMRLIGTKSELTNIIVDTCSHTLNKHQMSQGMLSRLCLTTHPLTQLVDDYISNKKQLDENACDEWFSEEVNKFSYLKDEYLDLAAIDFVFMPLCFKKHFSLFVVELKKNSVSYLNSSQDIILPQMVALVALYAARGVLKYTNQKLNRDVLGVKNMDVPKVPQQPARSLACGVFVIRFMEQWNGNEKSIETFVVWENLRNDKKNSMLMNERKKLVFELLTSEDNAIADDVWTKANAIGKKKKGEDKGA